MTVDVVNTSGKKLKTTSLPKEVFEVEVKPEVITQALRVYTTNQHQGSSVVKTRGQVKRTTAKAWRQKGTGRARHGSKRAPIFVGGGITHGPKSASPAKARMNKKTRRLALLGALSAQAKAKNIKIISGIEDLKPQTSKAQKVFESVAGYSHAPKDKIVLVLANPNKNVVLACRNLPGVIVSQAKRLNIYEILNANHLIFAQDSIAEVKNTYVGK